MRYIGDTTDRISFLSYFIKGNYDSSSELYYNSIAEKLFLTPYYWTTYDV